MIIYNNTKHELEQYLSKFDDGFSDRHAIRWLYKRNPNLWDQITALTEFLPYNSKPKQRCWHILNDCYIRPLCPVSGEYVKWWENRYLKFINRSSKMTYLNLTGTTKNQTAEARKKRANSNHLAWSEGGRKLPVLSEETKRVRAQKTKQTMQRRYGVDNPSHLKWVRDKISDKWVERGAVPKKDRSRKRLYHDAVWYYTDQSWKNNFDDINPDRLNRSDNALDHIYSIGQGFLDNIPPYILGHWANLRVISLSENSSKGMKCDKSQKELFEDYFSSY